MASDLVIRLTPEGGAVQTQVLCDSRPGFIDPFALWPPVRSTVRKLPVSAVF